MHAVCCCSLGYGFEQQHYARSRPCRSRFRRFCCRATSPWAPTAAMTKVHDSCRQSVQCKVLLMLCVVTVPVQPRCLLSHLVCYSMICNEITHSMVSRGLTRRSLRINSVGCIVFSACLRVTSYYCPSRQSRFWAHVFVEANTPPFMIRDGFE